MLEDKVEQVALAPPPRTKKQLRAFLGLTGFYRRFIQDYAKIAAPLTDALKFDSLALESNRRSGIYHVEETPMC